MNKLSFTAEPNPKHRIWGVYKQPRGCTEFALQIRLTSRTVAITTAKSLKDLHPKSGYGVLGAATREELPDTYVP